MGIRWERAAFGVAARRGALTGGTAGFVVGGVAGTLTFPLVVTLLWGVEGAAGGALTGSVLGVALHLVSERSASLTNLTTQVRSVASGRPPRTHWVRPLLSAGVEAGAVLGAAVGLGVGVWAYLPTAPVALVEGAVLGATSGLLLATLVALVIFLGLSGGRTVRVWRDRSGRMEA